LAAKLNNQHVIAEHLLTHFTQTSVVPAHQLRKNQGIDEDGVSTATGMGFKYIKTKDNLKDLIAHMIGIMGFLNKSFRAHFIAKMLKKELSDLRSYF
jgi:hypothetical protein